MFLVVSRTHINGHTVGLQETLHTAAPFICQLLCPYHVTLKYFALYWLLEYENAIVFSRNNWKQKWAKLGRGYIMLVKSN